MVRLHGFLNEANAELKAPRATWRSDDDHHPILDSTIIAGWWLSLPPWKMMEFVRLDHPNDIGEVNPNSMVWNHQPDSRIYSINTYKPI